ncbi:MAG: extracellular solute-binding protein [Candidatus Riflebacteria bacterium]|nr:extracellular solute-binding protein [Candidatus Riflebacteria bacterium]
MKNLSWKLLKLFLLLSLAIFFKGCGDTSNQPSSNREAKIVLWHTFTPSETETLNLILKSFSEKFPRIKVSVEAIPFAQARSKFEQAVKSGIAPDIFRSDRFWTLKFAKNGLLEPLEDSFKTEIEDMVGIAKTVVTQDGKIWGVPHSMDCLALFYNKKHFSEKGLSPPVDFDAFRETAKTLTRSDAGRFGFFMNPNGWWFEPMVFAFGGKFYDPSGNLSIRSEQTLKALHFLIDLKDTTKVMPPVNIRSDPYDLMMQSFKNGQVSMIFNGPWAIRDLLSALPFRDPSNLGVAHIPRGPAGCFSPVGCQSFVIPKGTRNFKDAVELIKFLCAPENLKQFATKNYFLPTRKSLINDPDIKKDPFLAAFISQINCTSLSDNSPSRIKLYIVLLENLKKCLNGDLAPEDALKDIENSYKKALD